MTIQVKETDPIEAMRAVLRVETAEVKDSKFPDERTGAEKQEFATELKVLSGAGERDGETFPEWFAFIPSKSLTTSSKTGELVKAALGADTEAETFEELARKLVGRTFCARLVRSGKNQDGPYTRVAHTTIGPIRSADEEEGFDDIPW